MRVIFKTNYMQDIRPWKDTYQLSLYLILLAIIFAAPWWLDAFYLGELTNVLIWAIAGLGLMVLTGHTGQVSLGHAAFLAFGCYANVILLEAGVPFLSCLPAGGHPDGSGWGDGRDPCPASAWHLSGDFHHGIVHLDG